MVLWPLQPVSQNSATEESVVVPAIRMATVWLPLVLPQLAFNQPIGDLNTARVTNMRGIFIMPGFLIRHF